MPPKMPTVQTGPFVQAVTDPSCIHLGIGQPSPTLLPLEQFREASVAAWAHIDPLMLQYHRSDGHPGLHSALAEFLTQARGDSVSPERFWITNGNSHGLSIVAQSLTKPGDDVVCEDPTYFLAHGILQDLGLQLHAIPMQSSGIDVAKLRARLDAGLRPKFVYTIPHHHNPTGITASPENFLALVELAEHFDFRVVCDDPYELLYFSPDRERADAKLSEAQKSRVIVLGTFSKIYAPGLRLGWIEGDQQLHRKLSERGVLKSGGGVNPIVGTVIEYEIRNGGLQTQLQTLRNTLGERCTKLHAALSSALPDCRIGPADGGYFIWIEFGPHIDAIELGRQARSHGVFFLAGPRATLSGKAYPHSGRVCFAMYQSDELETAAQRLGEAYRAYTSNASR